MSPRRQPTPPDTRRDEARIARAGWPQRGGGPGRVRARAALARLLWNADGTRRLVSVRTLDRALEALPTEELEWLTEFAAPGPLYFLPTREWIRALAEHLRGIGARRILEVAAGDGFLARSLATEAADLEVFASDSGAWEQPEGRMSHEEKRALRGTHVPGLLLGGDVLRLEAREAIRKLTPDAVVAAWLPPGPVLERIIRSPVAHVIEVGAPGGVTPDAWHWRFAHDQCTGPLESLGRCRLDTRPRKALHTRVTHYFGKAHPEFTVERVRPGDWLWQFRPEPEIQASARRRAAQG